MRVGRETQRSESRHGRFGFKSTNLSREFLHLVLELATRRLPLPLQVGLALAVVFKDSFALSELSGLFRQVAMAAFEPSDEFIPLRSDRLLFLFELRKQRFERGSLVGEFLMGEPEFIAELGSKPAQAFGQFIRGHAGSELRPELFGDQPHFESFAMQVQDVGPRSFQRGVTLVDPFPLGLERALLAMLLQFQLVPLLGQLLAVANGLFGGVGRFLIQIFSLPDQLFPLLVHGFLAFIQLQLQALERLSMFDQGLFGGFQRRVQIATRLVQFVAGGLHSRRLFRQAFFVFLEGLLPGRECRAMGLRCFGKLLPGFVQGGFGRDQAPRAGIELGQLPVQFLFAPGEFLRPFMHPHP